MRDAARPTLSSSTPTPFQNINPSSPSVRPTPPDELRTASRSARGGSTPSATYPWGGLKAGDARGDLVVKGVTLSTRRETDMANALLASAWATGEVGLRWLIRPEVDEYKLGECIADCWELVRVQQEDDGCESHALDVYVARKGSPVSQPWPLDRLLTLSRWRDSLAEKRTGLLRRICDAVWFESADGPHHPGEDTTVAL